MKKTIWAGKELLKAFGELLCLGYTFMSVFAKAVAKNLQGALQYLG